MILDILENAMNKTWTIIILIYVFIAPIVGYLVNSFLGYSIAGFLFLGLFFIVVIGGMHSIYLSYKNSKKRR